MQELKQLLGKYWAGSADAREIRRLSGKLAADEKEIMEFMQDEYLRGLEQANGNRNLNGHGNGVSAGQGGPGSLGNEGIKGAIDKGAFNKAAINAVAAEEMLQRIHARIDREEEKGSPDVVSKMPVRSYAVFFRAAAVVTGLVIGFWLLHKNDKKQNGLAAARQKQRIIQVANNTLLPENIPLPDGSTVILYPKSSLSYRLPFDSLQRNIAMQGKAVFKVVADSKKPFSVFADSIVTTVLGTSFRVTTQPDHCTVKVRLLEGKVVVKAPEKNGVVRMVYLKPGEECTVDKKLHTTGIYAFREGLNKKGSSVRVNKSEEINTLSFAREPLPNVLKIIEKTYHVQIRWKGNKTGKLLFTGKFYATDPLEMVIAAICNANDLAFEEKDDIIIIAPIK